MAENKNPGCLTSFLELFKSKPSTKDVVHNTLPLDVPEVLPYFVRDDFLSNAEASFFHVLKNMSGEQLVICPKVSLADIFYISHPDINMPYLNKINRKHVDFLLCHPKTLKPLLAIELDDSSHSRTDRIERDEFVDKVFEDADLPLVRIPAQMAYNTEQLGVTLRNALKKEMAQKQNVEKRSGDAVPPSCPKCGSQMVLRTAQRGNNIGKQFYGCPNFPKCRETILIT